MSLETRSLRESIRQRQAAAAGLEPGPEDRRRLREAVVAVAERFQESLESRPAFLEVEAPAEGLDRAPVGEAGFPLETVIELLEEEVLRPGGQPASGGHLAYLSGGGLYSSALADYLAAVSNKYAGISFTGPGPVRMENQLIRWVADLVGYPAGAGGCIASGGSLATLTAVTAARDAHGLKGADYAKAVVYLGSQTHHCLAKALRIAGLAEAPLRVVAEDGRGRLRPEALAEAMAADRAAGLRPWLVAATAGTTDAGAVDPLEELGAVARREGAWYHVDAAYGGFFLLTKHGRRLLRGIEGSDSAVLDPHKSLFLPWGSGILVVRDGTALVNSHRLTGSYLQDAEEAWHEQVSPADVSPELTKPFRALRLWLPLMLLGLEPFRAALEEKLLLARYFHREVAKLGYRVGPEPDLSVVTFRWAPPDLAPEEADAANRTIAETLRRDGRIFLSTTELQGRFTLRMAALAHRTHLRHVELALELLREARPV